MPINWLQSKKSDFKPNASVFSDLVSLYRDQGWFNLKINTVEHSVGDGHNTDYLTVWGSLAEYVYILLQDTVLTFSMDNNSTGITIIGDAAYYSKFFTFLQGKKPETGMPCI